MFKCLIMHVWMHVRECHHRFRVRVRVEATRRDSKRSGSEAFIQKKSILNLDLKFRPILISPMFSLYVAT